DLARVPVQDPRGRALVDLLRSRPAPPVIAPAGHAIDEDAAASLAELQVLAAREQAIGEEGRDDDDAPPERREALGEPGRLSLHAARRDPARGIEVVDHNRDAAALFGHSFRVKV